jgi:hypothetical protein
MFITLLSYLAAVVLHKSSQKACPFITFPLAASCQLLLVFLLRFVGIGLSSATPTDVYIVGLENYFSFVVTHE